MEGAQGPTCDVEGDRRLVPGFCPAPRGMHGLAHLDDHDDDRSCSRVTLLSCSVVSSFKTFPWWMSFCCVCGEVVCSLHPLNSLLHVQDLHLGSRTDSHGMPQLNKDL